MGNNQKKRRLRRHKKSLSAWEKLFLYISCQSDDLQRNEHLKKNEGRINPQQSHALPAAQFAFEQSGQRHQRHNAQHNGNLNQLRGIIPQS